jgi:hypothetical protein
MSEKASEAEPREKAESEQGTNPSTQTSFDMKVVQGPPTENLPHVQVQRAWDGQAMPPMEGIEESSRARALLAQFLLSKAREANPPIEAYDELPEAYITESLSVFSTEVLEWIRDYERRNKNRRALLEQIEALIRTRR